MVDDTAAGLRRLLDTLSSEFESPNPTLAPIDAASPHVDLRFQPKIDLQGRFLAGAQAIVPSGEDVARFAECALTSLFEDWLQLDRAGFSLRLAIALPLEALRALPLASLAPVWRETAPHWPGFIVEIGEDEIVRDIKAAQATAVELAPSGVSIAITNFGAGYSSMASLRELTFAEIKLNASFVVGCAENADNSAICQTAIELAHRFNAIAVAEGVTDMADLNALRIMGCDTGQGQLFAPSLPREAFIALLQRHNPPRASVAKNAAI